MAKTHHNPDYSKDRTADVIKHGSSPAVPNTRWEMCYEPTPKGSDYGGDTFQPRAGKDRPTPHKKVNECDH